MTLDGSKRALGTLLSHDPRERGGVHSFWRWHLCMGRVPPDLTILWTHAVPNRRERTIALTFDDGPNPAATPQLLDLLERYDARGTFFLIGLMSIRRVHTVRSGRHRNAA